MVDVLLTQISDDQIATVTLNRPDVHNAFNDDLIWEITDNFKKLSKNPDVRAIVLTGSGKSFSAGADLNWMKAAANYTHSENKRDALALSEMLQTVHACPKPTIAIVNGNAFGGGVGLVACCDIAISVRSAFFALSEVRLGLAPATIGPYVVRAIGTRASRRYFLTAERFTADDACEMGLVHELAPTLQAAFKTAGVHIKNILSGAPGAIAASKALIHELDGKELSADIQDYTSSLIADRRASDEGKEGITAFLEKRKASWVQS